MRIPRRDAVPITDLKPAARAGQILLENIMELMSLNLVTLLFSVPVLTIPAALSARLGVLRLWYCGEPCSVWSGFLSLFKDCFKRSLAAGAILFAGPLLAVYAIPFYREAVKTGGWIFLIPLIIVFLVCLAAGLSGPTLLLELTGVDLPLGKMLKNALLLGVVRFPQNLLFLAILGGMVLVLIVGLPVTAVLVLFAHFSLSGLAAVACAWPGIEQYIGKEDGSCGE